MQELEDNVDKAELRYGRIGERGVERVFCANLCFFSFILDRQFRFTIFKSAVKYIEYLTNTTFWCVFAWYIRLEHSFLL